MGDMTFKNHFEGLLICLLLAGCASTAQFNRTETVKIVLNDGAKISAKIIDVGRDQIVFEAKSRRDAYEYGEVLDVLRVRGIQLKDGTFLTVKEFRDYRAGKLSKKKPARNEPVRVTNAQQDSQPKHSSGDFQYEQLKKKPIAEMTENEYRYFLMMKEKELQAQAASTWPKASAPAPEHNLPGLQTPALSRMGSSISEPAQVDEFVASFIDAGLAGDYIIYLQRKKQSGQDLSSAESRMLAALQNNPQWLARLDDIRYLNTIAERAFSRAFLYNPDELQTKLSLHFDADVDMDYPDLVQQLHRQTGSKVRVSDYRILIEVFGENGAKAVKALLENYGVWEFAIRNPSLTAK